MLHRNNHGGQFWLQVIVYIILFVYVQKVTFEVS